MADYYILPRKLGSYKGKNEEIDGGSHNQTAYLNYNHAILYASGYDKHKSVFTYFKELILNISKSLFLHSPLPYTASTRYINNTLFERLRKTTIKNWHRFSRHFRKQRHLDFVKIVNWRNTWAIF